MSIGRDENDVLLYQDESNIGHKSVLVDEVVGSLVTEVAGKDMRYYLDVTFGCGGHTRALLDADPMAFVIGIDWDPRAVDEYAQVMYRAYPGRFRLVYGNFAHLYKIARREKFPALTGILADFGTSQVQIFGAPGLSFAVDAPLDMRMSLQHQQITAADIINRESPEYLRELFWQLGEEQYARTIVDLIIKERTLKPITTTHELASLVVRAKGKRERSGIHPATKVFQALRIMVNKELDNIHAFLPAAVQLLKPEGRLACISFHSLEDRIVKRYYAEQERLGLLRVITKKPLVAQEDELRINSSARSAKLRVAEKV